MSLVVDASVALKWALPEADSERAYALAVSGETLLLPDFWLSEATNVLWLRVRRGELSGAQAQERLSLLAATGTRLSTSNLNLHDRALDIALAIEHSPYDALYVAFALAVGADHVVAADQPFLAALRRHPDPAVARLALDLHDWASA